MKAWCLVLAALAFLAFLEAADLEHARKSQAVKVYKILASIPSEQRHDFLRYHLQKGHDLTQKEHNEKYPAFDVEITESESKLLYNYYSQYALVEDADVVKEVMTIICWGSKCIDFSDPGVHPN